MSVKLVDWIELFRLFTLILAAMLCLWQSSLLRKQLFRGGERQQQQMKLKQESGGKR